MKGMHDDLSYVQQILKRFGSIIYLGNRLDDLAMMEIELQDLYEYKLISEEEYIKAKTILTKEFHRLSKA